MIDKKTADKLKSKVAALKATANIVKIHENAGQVIGMNVEQTSVEMGKYGEQLLVVGTIDGEASRIYLNGKRREVFTAAFDGAGEYAFVVGESVELKSGNNYVPLELVEKL
jgi:hypothetical protein